MIILCVLQTVNLHNCCLSSVHWMLRMSYWSKRLWSVSWKVYPLRSVLFFKLRLVSLPKFLIFHYLLPLSPNHQGEQSWSSLTASPPSRTQTPWPCWTSSMWQSVASTQSCSATGKACSGNWWRNRLFYRRSRNRHFADWTGITDLLDEGRRRGWRDQSPETQSVLWMRVWGQTNKIYDQDKSWKKAALLREKKSGT